MRADEHLPRTWWPESNSWREKTETKFFRKQLFSLKLHLLVRGVSRKNVLKERQEFWTTTWSYYNIPRNSRRAVFVTSTTLWSPSWSCSSTTPESSTSTSTSIMETESRYGMTEGPMLKTQKSLIFLYYMRSISIIGLFPRSLLLSHLTCTNAATPWFLVIIFVLSSQ